MYDNKITYSKFNPYSELKAKARDDWRQKTYFHAIMDSLIEMFEYTNVPDGFEPVHFEEYLILDGVCGVAKDPNTNKITALRGGLAGEPDNYGHGTRFVGSCPNFSVDGKIGEDLAVCFNNHTHVPEFNVYRFSEMLSQTDLSMEFNIQKTRINPIVVVNDSKQAKAVKDLQIQLKYGNEMPTINEDSVNWSEDDKEIKMLEIADPALINKVQYLSEYHENLLKRLYTYYGVSILGSVRHSLVTNEQSESHASQSWIYPLNRLAERRAFVEMLNKVFNTNMSVDFSTVWKYNLDAFLSDKAKKDADLDYRVSETNRANAEAEKFRAEGTKHLAESETIKKEGTENENKDTETENTAE